MRIVTLNGTWRPPLTESSLFPILVALTIAIEASLLLAYINTWKNISSTEKIGVLMMCVLGNLISAFLGYLLYIGGV